jgi:hypothetical protein
MVATDGVFWDSPHSSLDLSDKLGDWELSVRDNLTLFKPGVYWDDTARMGLVNGDPVKFKARGVNAKAFSKYLTLIDEMFLNWCEGADIPEMRKEIYKGDELTAYAVKGWPFILFESGFSMTTIVQALQRNDWTQAGHVEDHMQVMQSSTPYEKRTNPTWNNQKMRVETEPRDLIDTQTTYYNKSYGMDDPFSFDYRESMGVHMEALNGELFNQWVAMLRKGE